MLRVALDSYTQVSFRAVCSRRGSQADADCDGNLKASITLHGPPRHTVLRAQTGAQTVFKGSSASQSRFQAQVDLTFLRIAQSVLE